VQLLRAALTNRASAYFYVVSNIARGAHFWNAIRDNYVTEYQQLFSMVQAVAGDRLWAWKWNAEYFRNEIIRVDASGADEEDDKNIYKFADLPGLGGLPMPSDEVWWLQLQRTMDVT
jgi:hypothetical protein